MPTENNWKRDKTFEAKRERIYKAYQSQDISELRTQQVKNSNHVAMELVFSTEQVIERVRQQLQLNLPFNTNITYVSPVEHPPGQGRTLGRIKFATEDKYEMMQFLKAVSHLHEIAGKAKEEIHRTLGLTDKDDTNTYLAELKLCKAQGKSLEDVYTKALDYPNKSLLWELGQYCQEQQLDDEALKYYLAIPENNPYYERANKHAYLLVQKRTAQLLMLVQDPRLDTESKKALNSELEFYKTTEVRLLLRYSLNDNFIKERFSERLDSAAYELSGGKGAPDIKGLTFSEEGFLTLLHYIADLRQKNHTLEQANAAAKKQATGLTEHLTRQGFYSAPKDITSENKDNSSADDSNLGPT
ncbi:hypothetical protein [Legionella sp. WA2022007384]